MYDEMMEGEAVEITSKFNQLRLLEKANPYQLR